MTWDTRTMSGGTDAPTSDGMASKMTDWTDLNYAVVDVEGNGQQPPDLVELAVVPIIGGVIGEPVSWLVRPAGPTKYVATRIHGLTNKDVADAPEFAGIVAEVSRALKGSTLIAHNAHVDLDVLGASLVTAGSAPRCSTRSSWLVGWFPDTTAIGSAPWSSTSHWQRSCPTV